jgi:hypothetical protein
MVVSHWRVFTDTNRPEAAQRLTAKLQAQTGREFRQIGINDYHKGGHVVTFDIQHEIDQWEAAAYDVIACAQRMAAGWTLSGSIDEELDLIATKTSVAGIKMVSCFCPRPGSPNAK